MASGPIVSVLMAVYNGERYLREAVESILAQTFKDFEFVIVDDGSSDGTPAMLKAFATTDPRVRLIWQEHLGLVAALNSGCAAARGRYIARMDADDIAVPDRLDQQVCVLEAQPVVAVLGGAVVLMDASGRAFRAAEFPLESQHIKSEQLTRMNAGIVHPTVMMRKAAWEAVGGYRAAFLHAEDFDLWLRIGEHHEMANLRQPLIKYRVHSGQVGLEHARQQAISTLGAWRAAILRREAGKDPMGKCDLVTQELLQNLGVRLREVQDTVVALYLHKAQWMSATAQYPAALEMLNRAKGVCREGPVSGKMIEKAYRACAQVRWDQRRWLEAGVQMGRFAMARLRRKTGGSLGRKLLGGGR